MFDMWRVFQDVFSIIVMMASNSKLHINTTIRNVINQSNVTEVIKIQSKDTNANSTILIVQY